MSTYLLKNVPEPLRQEARIYAAKNRTTFRTMLLQGVEMVMKKKKKKKRAAGTRGT
jgi:hypothetical protein